MKHIQTELNLGIAITSDNPHTPTKPQYDPYWDELCWEEQSTCKSVGEQVSHSTQKSAHQHEIQTNHFVEKYYVERGNNKYWYWRYTWMEGRKLRRKYVGSVNSARARKKKQVIEDCIRKNLHPQNIITILNNFSNNSQIH
ncbi:hypothetical protein NIES267_55030 [Calothrix parasitica NIES-267]|uniref:Uncharacterized protein n=1 Tax=Calothrix parasitica NIES-267 TaxID=1973488 RepID=A0A1Z4LXL7_9CYAN|nr:hypothetical protein NIES267_55030 [Calothrix parasitica NIES-267]